METAIPAVTVRMRSLGDKLSCRGIGGSTPPRPNFGGEMKISVRVTKKLELEDEKLTIILDALKIAEKFTQTPKRKTEFTDFRQELEGELYRIGKA